MPATSIRRRRGRVRWLALGLVALLLLLAVVDLRLVTGRFHRIEVTLPQSVGPRTWVIVGLDDRERADDQIRSTTGEPADQPGTRADVVILVTQTSQGLRGLAIPRNLMVGKPIWRDPSSHQRLAVSWANSPQVFIDRLCSDLSIPVDHLVTIDLQGFVAVVDALGGVEIDVPHAMRDELAKLEIPAGRQLMDGITALSYVRSRSGEVLINGQWQLEADGEAARRQRQGQLLAAVTERARTRPWLWQKLAWQGSPNLGLDQQTSIGELMGLAAGFEVDQLPTQQVADGQASLLDAASRQVLDEYGYTAGCQPG